MNDRFHMKKTALVLCAVVAVACESGMQSPVSPSATIGSASALNADGSNLKASSPLAIAPVFESTNIGVTPTLAARAGANDFSQTARHHSFIYRRHRDVQGRGLPICKRLQSGESLRVVRATELHKQ